MFDFERGGATRVPVFSQRVERLDLGRAIRHVAHDDIGEVHLVRAQTKGDPLRGAVAVASKAHIQSPGKKCVSRQNPATNN